MKSFGLGYWESIFVAQNNFRKRLTVAILVSATAFILTLLFFRITGFYFPSIVTISIILIALYSGFILSLIIAAALRGIAFYYFLPFLGESAPKTSVYEHIFFSVVIAVLVSFLGSAARAGMRSVIIAKKVADEAKLEAQEISLMMEKVLALVTHDIRNPMTSIKIGCEMLMRSIESSSPQKLIVTKMLNSLNRVDSMIQSLLDVEKMRAGKGIPITLEFCDLSTRLSIFIAQLSLSDAHVIQYESCEIPSAWWGIADIERALENLITNAVKYGDAGTIFVQLEHKENRVFLSVRNHGPEISSDDQGRLFDAFNRTSTSEGGSIRGWGLGLALVKGVAEAHGGKVRVTSDRTNGTLFTLELPITQDLKNDESLKE